LYLFHRTGFVLQIHGVGRRRRGYGMLVDDLPVTVAVQEHAESIKTSNGPPQLYAIAQKNRDRRSFPLQMLEEGVLKAMNIVVCHLVRLGALNETRTFRRQLQLTGKPLVEAEWARARVGLAPRAGLPEANDIAGLDCQTILRSSFEP
jgi:hypothetical protein